MGLTRRETGGRGYSGPGLSPVYLLSVPGAGRVTTYRMRKALEPPCYLRAPHLEERLPWGGQPEPVTGVLTCDVYRLAHQTQTGNTFTLF